MQTKMNFRVLPAGQDWVEFPVLASVCPKCGKMDLNVAVPAQFAHDPLEETKDEIPSRGVPKGPTDQVPILGK